MKKISHKEFLILLVKSVGDKYGDKRQKSKSPTFLLQFLGTIVGLIRKFGFTKKEAEEIFRNYKKLYKVSIAWTQKQIKKAHRRGYAIGAFNMRLLTPKLKQTVYGSSNLPHEVQGEARTAGNMLSGQSYGLLTIRAFYRFMRTVLNSKYKLKISPIATIYDSIYVEADLDVDQIYFINKHLIKNMSRTDRCPELDHPTVKMSATLILHYPDWSHEIKIPNGASKKQIKKILKEAINGNIKAKKPK